MIQNLRISENGSGMLPQGSPKFRNSANPTQGEVMHAKKVNRFLSATSNPDQYLRKASGIASSNELESTKAKKSRTSVLRP